MAANDDSAASSDDDEDGFEIEISAALPSNPSLGHIIDDRSTHFIAVQISDQEIRENALRIQQRVIDHDADMVSLDKLQIKLLERNIFIKFCRLTAQ